MKSGDAFWPGGMHFLPLRSKFESLPLANCEVMNTLYSLDIRHGRSGILPNRYPGPIHRIVIDSALRDISTHEHAKETKDFLTDNVGSMGLLYQTSKFILLSASSRLIGIYTI